MMLFDTDVLSTLRRLERAAPHFSAWARTVQTASAYVSVVTILELEQGVLSMERRDRRQGGELRAWLERVVIPTYAERLLDVDLAVARACARLHVPDPRPERDSLIAATALVHGLTVVTGNVRDFAPMVVPLLNPWKPR